MPRFSILVANYNHERFVGAAVQSCLAQDFPADRYEVVVVDDGSTDGSRAVLERFQGEARVKLVFQANGGQAAAFAAGFAASSGEIICLLDADDTFHPAKLAVLDREMRGAEDGLVCHELEVWDEVRSRAVGPGWLRQNGIPAHFASLSVAQLLDKPHPFPFAVPCGMAVGRTVLSRVLPAVPQGDWRAGADNPLAWGAFIAGGPVRYLQQPLGRYRIHEANAFIRLRDGIVEHNRAWQSLWPRLLAFLRGFLPTAKLAAQDTRNWEALLQRFDMHARDARSVPGAGLADRAALAAWARELLAPIAAGRPLPARATMHLPRVQEMETFARMLLGLALTGEVPPTALERLAQGVDPRHAKYWGDPVDYDQRIVELSDIALALCLAPALLWEPLAPQAKSDLLDYLRAGSEREVHANNWRWFRVALNVALERLGGQPDRARMAQDLDALESDAAADGWVRDGAAGPCDHYNAWALHFHALLYTKLDPRADPARCRRLRERAAAFALQYLGWFAPNGACLPFGRSLHYRFAPAAFWGALAYAGVQALPAGELKGLALRHLRWWRAQDLRSPDGLLPIGYAYPNDRVGEAYAGPGAAYLACKAFLPLLLPEEHAFWQARELPLRGPPAGLGAQPSPGLLLTRSDMGGHALALCAGIEAPVPGVHRAEAYAKFCYSTHFGQGMEEGSLDSALALSEDGARWRVRERSRARRVEGGLVYCAWQPWPDVEVQTWLVPAGVWHVRIHAVRTPRALHSAEGGFALGAVNGVEAAAHPGEAFARGVHGAVAALDLIGKRPAALVAGAPGAGLRHPRTVVPVLRGSHPAGAWWLAAAFLGTRSGARPPAPRVAAAQGGYAIVGEGGAILCRIGRREGGA